MVLVSTTGAHRCSFRGQFASMANGRTTGGSHRWICWWTFTERTNQKAERHRVRNLNCGDLIRANRDPNGEDGFTEGLRGATWGEGETGGVRSPRRPPLAPNPLTCMFMTCDCSFMIIEFIMHLSSKLWLLYRTGGNLNLKFYNKMWKEN